MNDQLDDFLCQAQVEEIYTELMLEEMNDYHAFLRQQEEQQEQTDIQL